MGEYLKYVTLIVIGICLHHLWSYIKQLETRVANLSLILDIYEKAYGHKPIRESIKEDANDKD